MAEWISRLDHLPEPERQVVFAGIKQGDPDDHPGKRYVALGHMGKDGWWHGRGVLSESSSS